MLESRLQSQLFKNRGLREMVYLAYYAAVEMSAVKIAEPKKKPSDGRVSKLLKLQRPTDLNGHLDLWHVQNRYVLEEKNHKDYAKSLCFVQRVWIKQFKDLTHFKIKPLLRKIWSFAKKYPTPSVRDVCQKFCFLHSLFPLKILVPLEQFTTLKLEFWVLCVEGQQCSCKWGVPSDVLIYMNTFCSLVKPVCQKQTLFCIFVFNIQTLGSSKSLLPRRNNNIATARHRHRRCEKLTPSQRDVDTATARDQHHHRHEETPTTILPHRDTDTPTTELQHRDCKK